MTAMYGEEIADLLFNRKTGEKFINQIRYGGERGMTLDYNRTFSAVSILRKVGNDGFHLSVYHNIHAMYPIGLTLLQNKKIAQYKCTEI